MMPAFRLTASCIWNSFRSSGKRHLLLTGGRGAGKTTLLSQLFPEQCPGLTTWAEPGRAVYLKENTTDSVVQVGKFDPSLPGKENRMTLCGEGFRSLGIPALERCAVRNEEWVTIDEIGYLESACPEYQTALSTLMERKRLAAVVRKQQLPFLKELLDREDTFVADLDNPFGDVGCVIMASGLGRRFGGNKLMADFHGKPLICGVLDAVQGICSRQVVVTRHESVAAYCRSRGMDAVLHSLPYRSDTVRLGLQALGEDLKGCMFCSGDQPLLRWETVAALALAGVNHNECIWRAAWKDNPGTPVLFPAWTFSELLTLPEGFGGSCIVKKYPEQVRFVSVQDQCELKDVDTQEDLCVLLEQ